MTAQTDVRVTSTGSNYSDDAERWFMDASLGPIGRMAKLTDDAPQQLTSDDGTPLVDHEGQPVMQDRYQRTVSATLYRQGKQIARIGGLRRWDADNVAEQWVRAGE